MKDGTLYPKDQSLALLLAGNPGTGKTTCAFTFPDPYIIDCEGNLKSGMERFPGKRFWWDNPEIGDDGKEVPTHEWWPRLEKLIKANAANPEVKSIVLDGLGRVAHQLKEYIIYEAARMGEKLPVVAGDKQMSQALWSPYAKKLQELIWLLRRYRKPLLVTCHLKVDENELTSVKEQRVALQGMLVNEYPKLFSDFFQTMAAPNSDNRYKTSNGVRYYIRTAPTNRIELKCSCGLPAEFEIADECWQKVLARLTA